MSSKIFSLKNKIINKIKYLLLIFIILLFLISITIYFYANDSIIISSILLGMYFVSFYLFLIKYLEKILEDNLFSRIKLLKNEIKQIKEDNSFNNLSIQGFDEFDQLVHFTNEVLTDYKKAIEIEKKNSLIDPLTLCYNRRALKSQFESFKKLSIRENNQIGFLLIDLDKFKEINDNYGHDIGDEILVLFTKIIKRLLREYDYFYRLGGEEFLIVFSNLGENNAQNISNRLLRHIPAEFNKKYNKIDRDVTFSGGFKSINFSQKEFENITFETVFKQLDKLLYKAKNEGRNQIKY